MCEMMRKTLFTFNKLIENLSITDLKPEQRLWSNQSIARSDMLFPADREIRNVPERRFDSGSAGAFAPDSKSLPAGETNQN